MNPVHDDGLGCARGLTIWVPVMLMVYAALAVGFVLIWRAI